MLILIRGSSSEGWEGIFMVGIGSALSLIQGCRLLPSNGLSMSRASESSGGTYPSTWQKEGEQVGGGEGERERQ